MLPHLLNEKDNDRCGLWLNDPFLWSCILFSTHISCYGLNPMWFLPFDMLQCSFCLSVPVKPQSVKSFSCENHILTSTWAYCHHLIGLIIEACWRRGSWPELSHIRSDISFVSLWKFKLLDTSIQTLADVYIL